MQSLNLRFFFVILFILTFVLIGCSRNSVTVDGASIPESDISRIVTAQEQMMGPLAKNQEAAIRANVTQTLVNQALLLQEANKEGIKVTDQEVSQKYNELKKAWDTNVETQKSLKAQGYTEANMKEKVIDQLMIDNLTKRLVKVSDEQVQNFYQSHLFQYSLYTLRTGEAKDQTAAKALSEDTSKLKESTISYSQLPVQIQQAIREGRDLVNRPNTVATDGSRYSVIIMTAVTPQPFEHVQTQVKEQYVSDQRIAKTQELIAKLRKEAHISGK